jgi:hypothetical protein
VQGRVDDLDRQLTNLHQVVAAQPAVRVARPSEQERDRPPRTPTLRPLPPAIALSAPPDADRSRQAMRLARDRVVETRERGWGISR